MLKGTLWNQQLHRLGARLTVLEDKPEETLIATLKALWLTASGEPMSVEKAVDSCLPALDVAQEKKLYRLVDDRLSGIPLAHLTGFQQFMGVELLAGPQALIPRKETEILAQQASGALLQLSQQQDEIMLLDICTGAGNLIVSLALHHPKTKGYAADLSVDAVELAKENVKYHHLQDRVTVFQGDLLSPFECENFYHQVDLLLCNPPYISSSKVPDMAEEISQHEPSLAFDGGPFGIKILNALIKQAPKFLKPGGWLMFEVGLGQGESFSKRLAKTYQNVKTANDKDGEIRVVMGQTIRSYPC